MKVGYARVSTAEQVVDLQMDALKRAGCDTIFADIGVSGVLRNRPEWNSCLKSLKAGDILVVYSLSRAGRSVLHLAELTKNMTDRNVEFVSLTEGIDSTTSCGRMVYHMLAAVAEFERDLILERTEAGRASARERGVRMGRPPKMTPDTRKYIISLRAAGVKIPTIMESTGFSRAQIYKTIENTLAA